MMSGHRTVQEPTVTGLRELKALGSAEPRARRALSPAARPELPVSSPQGGRGKRPHPATCPALCTVTERASAGTAKLHHTGVQRALHSGGCGLDTPCKHSLLFKMVEAGTRWPFCAAQAPTSHAPSEAAPSICQRTECDHPCQLTAPCLAEGKPCACPSLGAACTCTSSTKTRGCLDRCAMDTEPQGSCQHQGAAVCREGLTSSCPRLPQHSES